MKAPAQKFDAPSVGARFVIIECECEDLKLEAGIPKSADKTTRKSQ